MFVEFNYEPQAPSPTMTSFLRKAAIGNKKIYVNVSLLI